MSSSSSGLNSSPLKMSHPQARPSSAGGKFGPGKLSSGVVLNKKPVSHHSSKLNRRWSLDNLAESIDHKEGYVKDLRRHQNSLTSIKDEEYPYMLTEHEERERSNSACGVLPEEPSTSTTTTQQQQQQQQPPPSAAIVGNRQKSRLILKERNRSGSMDLGKLMPKSAGSSKLRHHHHLSGAAGGSPSSSSGSSASARSSFLAYSSSIDITVPEENEIPSTTTILPLSDSTASAAAATATPHSPASASSTPTRHGPLSRYSPTRIANLEAKASGAGGGGGGKAFLRQRSSSLPRILPPILDADDAHHEESGVAAGGAPNSNSQLQQQQQQLDRQSNVVVREMQKFVCRQATDVSELLPLPIPTNSRQGKSHKLESAAASSNKSSNLHSLLLAKTLAKIHGIFWAIKQTSPNLYSEFLTTLVIHDKPGIPADMLEPIYSQLGLDSPGQEKLARELNYLSSHLSLPISIIVHSDLDLSRVVFRYQEDHLPVSLMLPGLNQSIVGSPLLDLYCHAYEKLIICQDPSFKSLLPEFLQNYQKSFDLTCKSLRLASSSGGSCQSLEAISEDFARFFRAGMILVDARRNAYKLSDTCLSWLKEEEAHIQDIAGILAPGKK